MRAMNPVPRKNTKGHDYRCTVCGRLHEGDKATEPKPEETK